MSHNKCDAFLILRLALNTRVLNTTFEYPLLLFEPQSEVLFFFTTLITTNPNDPNNPNNPNNPDNPDNPNNPNTPNNPNNPNNPPPSSLPLRTP